MDIRYAARQSLLEERLRAYVQIIERELPGVSRAPLQVDPAGSKQRWRAAVTAQSSIAGKSEEAAQRAVISLLNQLTRIATSVNWWGYTANGVIAETIEHICASEDVSSVTAQKAWASYQAACRDIPELLAASAERLRDLADRKEQAEADWQDAWSRWHAAHPGE